LSEVGRGSLERRCGRAATNSTISFLRLARRPRAGGWLRRHEIHETGRADRRSGRRRGAEGCCMLGVFLWLKSGIYPRFLLAVSICVAAFRAGDGSTIYLIYDARQSDLFSAVQALRLRSSV
jgi:hypothetical protein